MSRPVVVYQGWLVNCDRCSFNQYAPTQQEAKALADRHAAECPAGAVSEDPANFRRPWRP